MSSADTRPVGYPDWPAKEEKMKPDLEDMALAALGSGPEAPYAQCCLGVMYASGYDVGRDEAEAAKWFRLAADRGLALAQYFLGALHAQGRGVPLDVPEALKWFHLAAAQGNEDAQWFINGLEPSPPGNPEG